MKKNIIYLLLLMLVFTTGINAQQTVVQAQAVNNANGTKQMIVTDAAGKVTTLTAGDDATLKAKYLDFITQQAVQSKPAATEQKPKIINHRAVLGLNGKQQIIITFASGKEIAIDAVAGQTIQETYLVYLKKEGLDCGCSPAVAPTDSESNTHTVTKTATLKNN